MTPYMETFAKMKLNIHKNSIFHQLTEIGINKNKGIFLFECKIRVMTPNSQSTEHTNDIGSWTFLFMYYGHILLSLNLSTER